MPRSQFGAMKLSQEVSVQPWRDSSLIFTIQNGSNIQYHSWSHFLDLNYIFPRFLKKEMFHNIRLNEFQCRTSITSVYLFSLAALCATSCFALEKFNRIGSISKSIEFRVAHEREVIDIHLRQKKKTTQFLTSSGYCK